MAKLVRADPLKPRLESLHALIAIRSRFQSVQIQQ